MVSDDIPPSPRPRLVRVSMVDSFRKAIETAEQAGADRADMTLRLTLRDASNIRRDANIPTEDITFADGEMRLLKVKVVSGGVTESKLDLGAA